MLSEEQVRAELKAAWDEDWRAKCRTRGSSLVGGLGSLLQEICTVRKTTYYDYDEEDRREFEKSLLTWAGELDSTDLETRQEFFSVLFPKSGHTLSRRGEGWLISRLGVAGIMYFTGFRIILSLAYGIVCAGYSRWQGGIGGYDKDVCWLAQWREGLSYFAYDTLLSEFFAAVLDGSGSEADAVYGILRDSVEGIGPVPGDPRGAYRAFMSCSRTDAWEFTEQLLLVAQREEGLRQSLVESAIRGHPGLLKRVFEGHS